MASWRKVALEIVLWVFAAFLAWVFIRQGVAKFDDSSGWSRAFRTWHFPVWFRILIGVLETSAAGLLLWKRTAFAGAIIIIVVMLGAMGTHVYWGRPSQVTSEILPLFLSTMVALGRRKVFVWQRSQLVPASA
jgi:putative oxidoreductase